MARIWLYSVSHRFWPSHDHSAHLLSTLHWQIARLGILRPFALRRIVARGRGVSRSSTTDPTGRGYNTARRVIIMSGSLHPAEIHRRRHRQEKRNKLRAKLAAAPAGERAAIEAKLQRTFARPRHEALQ
jgi:hypothetical protein